MKCRWCANLKDGATCVNGSCPYRGKVCGMVEHPEVCKYSETEYEASELVKILRGCGSYEYLCDRCPARGSDTPCESKEALLQAADMLEKLAAEKETWERLFPEPPKEEER